MPVINIYDVMRRNLHNHTVTRNTFTTQVKCSCGTFGDVRHYRTYDDWVNHIVDLSQSEVNGER